MAALPNNNAVIEFAAERWSREQLFWAKQWLLGNTQPMKTKAAHGLYVQWCIAREYDSVNLKEFGKSAPKVRGIKNIVSASTAPAMLGCPEDEIVTRYVADLYVDPELVVWTMDLEQGGTVSEVDIVQTSYKRATAITLLYDIGALCGTPTRITHMTAGKLRQEVMHNISPNYVPPVPRELPAAAPEAHVDLTIPAELIERVHKTRYLTYSDVARAAREYENKQCVYVLLLDPLYMVQLFRPKPGTNPLPNIYKYGKTSNLRQRLWTYVKTGIVKIVQIIDCGPNHNCDKMSDVENAIGTLANDRSERYKSITARELIITHDIDMYINHGRSILWT